MSTVVSTIRDSIKNKVAEMGTLAYVYDYDTGLVQGTPFATVTPISGLTEWGDSAGNQSGRNIQTMDFVVKVFQSRDSDDFDEQMAENISLGVLDEMLTAFQSDTTLSGSVLWQRPTSWSFEYEILDQVVRTLQVTITVQKEVNSK